MHYNIVSYYDYDGKQYIKENESLKINFDL